MMRLNKTQLLNVEAQPVLPAILLVLCAVVLFSLSDVLAKLLRQFLPAVEIAWMPYLVFAGFGVLLAGRNRFAGLCPRQPVLQALRCVVLAGSAVLFIAGLGYLHVAEATAISFISAPEAP
jgi:drug/metabolite transporter (DMT)-like permease